MANGTHRNPFHNPTRPIEITHRNETAFWLQVDEGDGSGCWLWTGKTHLGYGKINSLYAHRYAYTLAYGPIPQGLTIDHLCRVRGCVRPDHLEAVTNGENMRRARAFQSGRQGLPPAGYQPPAPTESQVRQRVRRVQLAVAYMRAEKSRLPAGTRD